MRLLSLVVGVLLLIAGWGLYVLESGVSSDKSGIQIKIISHLSVCIGVILIGIARLKKRN